MIAKHEHRGARIQGHLVAFRPLHQALAAGREVVDNLRGVEAQPVEIDQVDVGVLAALEPPTVVEAEEIGGFAGLALDQIFERQTRAALPVAASMRQHVGLRAGIDDHRDMRAAIAQPEQCRRIG